MFKRKRAKTWLQTFVELVYPRGGWRRAAAYVMHRLRRLPDPPHRIARGVAAGVFVCFTPFFGFHFMLAAALSVIMQGNVLAALLATFVGNPVTFPLIGALALELGQWMLGTPNVGPMHEVFAGFGRASAELWHNLVSVFTPELAHWDRLGAFFWRVMWPYMVGGLVPGVLSGVGAYLLTVPAVRAYQRRRISRLKTRFKARQKGFDAVDGT